MRDVRANSGSGVLYVNNTPLPTDKKPYWAIITIICLIWSFFCSLIILRKRTISFRFLALTLAVSIFFTSLPIDYARAAEAPRGHNYTPENFSIPKNLATIADSWSPDPASGPDNPPTLIHIQDAHCNYYAQRKICEIIEYLNKNYGVSVVNLEGGKGSYDLSVFTDVENNRARSEVSDYFLREGVINGAEFFAINNPDTVTLWGIEETGPYIDNLKAYRKSLENKKTAGQHITRLASLLGGLKKDVYSDEIIEFERYYGGYVKDEIDFSEFITYIAEKARDSGLRDDLYPNVGLLAKSIKDEKNIDPEKANTERNQLIEMLQKTLSNKEMEELAKKAIHFKEEKINEKEFYEYIARKARSIDVDMKQFQELEKYISYVSAYTDVDKIKITEEIDMLDSILRNKLYVNDEQKELGTLTKNALILEKMLNLTFTRKDYEYYLEKKASFTRESCISFIRKHEKNGAINEIEDALSDLDRLREEASISYEYTFRRDHAFLKNLKFSPSKTTILITGGFHSRSLKELFKKNNISFVSILPQFKNDKNYTNPYAKLVSGEQNSVFNKISDILTNTLALASILSDKGICVEANGERAFLIGRLAVRWRNALAIGHDGAVFKYSDEVIGALDRRGNAVDEAALKNPAEIDIKNEAGLLGMDIEKVIVETPEIAISAPLAPYGVRGYGVMKRPLLRRMWVLAATFLGVVLIRPLKLYGDGLEELTLLARDGGGITVVTYAALGITACALSAAIIFRMVKNIRLAMKGGPVDQSACRVIPRTELWQKIETQNVKSILYPACGLDFKTVVRDFLRKIPTITDVHLVDDGSQKEHPIEFVMGEVFSFLNMLDEYEIAWEAKDERITVTQTPVRWKYRVDIKDKKLGDTYTIVAKNINTGILTRFHLHYCDYLSARNLKEISDITLIKYPGEYGKLAKTQLQRSFYRRALADTRDGGYIYVVQAHPPIDESFLKKTRLVATDSYETKKIAIELAEGMEPLDWGWVYSKEGIAWRESMLSPSQYALYQKKLKKTDADVEIPDETTSGEGGSLMGKLYIKRQNSRQKIREDLIAELMPLYDEHKYIAIAHVFTKPAELAAISPDCEGEPPLLRPGREKEIARLAEYLNAQDNPREFVDPEKCYSVLTEFSETVVEFGAGNGHVGFCLAEANPDVGFLVTDWHCKLPSSDIEKQNKKAFEGGTLEGQKQCEDASRQELDNLVMAKASFDLLFALPDSSIDRILFISPDWGVTKSFADLLKNHPELKDKLKPHGKVIVRPYLNWEPIIESFEGALNFEGEIVGDCKFMGIDLYTASNQYPKGESEEANRLLVFGKDEESEDVKEPREVLFAESTQLLRKSGPTIVVESVATLGDREPVRGFLSRVKRAMNAAGQNITADVYVAGDWGELKRNIDRMLEEFNAHATEDPRTRMAIRLAFVESTIGEAGVIKKSLLDFIENRLLEINGYFDENRSESERRMIRLMVEKDIMPNKIHLVSVNIGDAEHIDSGIDFMTDITMLECHRYMAGDYKDDEGIRGELENRFLSLLRLSIGNYGKLIEASGRESASSVINKILGGYMLFARSITEELRGVLRRYRKALISI